MTSAWNKIVLHLSIIDIDKNYNFFDTHTVWQL